MLDRILDLFRGPDPTSNWRLSVARPLTLDLATGTLNGIRHNAPYTELADWGRPANPRPVRSELFVYPEMGLAFFTSDGRVLGAGVEFRPHDVFGEPGPAGAFEGFRPARLRMVDADGSEFHAAPETTPEEVRARFGEPAEVDEVAEWLGLLYKRPGWEFEFEFDARRVLSSVAITHYLDETG